MNRSPSVAALAVFALAAVAAADEYTVTPFSGGFVTVPKIPASGDPSPNAIETVIASKRDGVTVPLPLPFKFPFFGRVYDTISISDDGWLAFGSTSAVQSANPTLPSTDPPNAVVAALWDRLATRKGDVVAFFKDPTTTVASPNRVFVIAWQNVNLSDKHGKDDLSFEVLLHESTGVVEIAYDSSKGRWNNLSYTAGIENETGTRAFGGPTETNTNTGKPPADQRFTPNVVNVTGTITRDRPSTTESGLSAADDLTNLPVVGADVALVREDTQDVIAAGRTDATGAYSLTSYGIDGSPTFAVDLLCSGAECRVTDASAAVWKRRVAAGVVPVGSPVVPIVHLDVSTDVSDLGAFRKALNIQQAAQRGYAWALAAFETQNKSDKALREQFPQLQIRWVPGALVASGYRPAGTSTSAQATISDNQKNVDGSTNSDVYDDDVILREYAQHLLATMTTFPGAIATHVWVTPTSVPPIAPESEGAAFLDGFSFWFAAAVQGRPHFVDAFVDATSAPKATVFDLEGPSPAATGPQNAGAVAASLWDLVDPANEATDAFDGSLPATGYAVFTTIDDRTVGTDGTLSVPAGTASPTFESFAAKWIPAQSPDAAAASAREFIAHLTLPDDKFEANDAAADPAQPFTPDVSGGSKMTSLVLNQANTDRFTFALGATPTSFALSCPEATVVEMTLRSSDSTDSAIPLAAAPSTTSPIVVSTVAGQAPGTYVVQMKWVSGPTAHYSLSTFTTPSLATQIPSTWTVGLPFNQTLAINGGVPPATFTLASGAVPGLSLQSGTNYVGTPTKAGTYPLVFTLTDASGAGPQTLPATTLQIVEGLALPRVFGLAAGKPVSADVGRGGVNPTWTKGTDTLPAGFTLTDGASLHLAAPTADVGTFTISGSAVDPAPLNATLAKSTSRIVVCEAFDKAARSSPNKGDSFGYWFDAIAGSTTSLVLRFSGKNAPAFDSLVDDRGTPVALSDRALTQTSSGVRIVDVVVPRTSRYFLVFAAAPTFSGKVAATTLRVRPPLRVAGVANIAAGSPTGQARFTAIAGSTATITVRSGQAPVAAAPGTVSLAPPGGADAALQPTRTASDGSSETFVGVALPTGGEYVLTFGAAGTSAGPLAVSIVIVPPKNAVFSLD